MNRILPIHEKILNGAAPVRSEAEPKEAADPRRSRFANGSKFIRGSIIFSAILLLVAGCGHRELPVVKVTGTVTYRGEALDNALIRFLPVESSGRVASGLSSEDGSFRLMTQGAKSEGCLPGRYTVTVGKEIALDETGNPMKPSTEMPTPGTPPTRTGPPRMKSVLPEPYGRADSSGFEAEVLRRGKNHFVFELNDK